MEQEQKDLIRGLPDVVQALIAKVHVQVNDAMVEMLEPCDSPIEQQMAVGLAYLLLNDDEVFVQPQEVIRARGKDYRVDFLLTQYNILFDNDGNPYFDWETRLAIECDGWDYHSSKEQLAYDNKRERDLLVYENLPIIRFTGSEIYKDPITCASQALHVLRKINQHENAKANALVGSLRNIRGDRNGQTKAEG